MKNVYEAPKVMVSDRTDVVQSLIISTILPALGPSGAPVGTITTIIIEPF